MKMFASFLVVCVCLFCRVPEFSQVTGATLSGTIADSSGGVLVGPQISITNTTTGIGKDLH